MIIRIKKQTAHLLFSCLAYALLFFCMLIGSSFLSYDVSGLNITNTTVLARVNITNTEPVLYRVDISPEGPIDLIAGTTRLVVCNGSYYDPNGFSDVTNASATLYRDNVASNAQDDNNTHYTNFSCTPCEVIPGSNSQNGSCACNFAVQYYADNGTWQCNMTIGDSVLLNSSQNSSGFTINEVLGIAIESPMLDYGNVSASSVSLPRRQNVTNIGNVPINVTVRGYGGDNETTGINYTMICESGMNISFGNQRFSVGNDTSFADMLNLTNFTRQVPSLTIPYRTVDTGLGNSSNATFWRLQIPFGAGGVCNGSIVFGALRWSMDP